MVTYIWQLDGWQNHSVPNFRWDAESLRTPLAHIKTSLQDLVPADPSIDEPLVANELTAQLQIDALVQSALRSSEIEGELLDVASVRSSVVNKLGIDVAGAPGLQTGLPQTGTQQTDALVELLIDATSKLDEPLTRRMLCDWQAALFTSTYAWQSINIGDLRGDQPMQVLSGRVDKPTVHFEAPPRSVLDEELLRFVDWFNHPPDKLNAYVRAAIAHLWFVTLHPFDDGNGRVARALTDRALAQAESSPVRFYSYSAAIMAKRNEYYTQLERAQKGSLEITGWIEWSLDVLADAIALSKVRYDQVLYKTRFWKTHAQTVLNERQVKVLNRLLDSKGSDFNDGINAAKYRSLGGVSKSTATRELTSLLEKGCVVKLPGGGRSTRYRLPEL